MYIHMTRLVRQIAAKAGSQDGKSRARFSFDFDNFSLRCHPLLDEKLPSIFVRAQMTLATEDPCLNIPRRSYVNVQCD